MSMEDKIIKDIDSLPKDQKEKVLQKIKDKYFIKDDAFVVGGNYNFWLNEKDEDYES